MWQAVSAAQQAGIAVVLEALLCALDGGLQGQGGRAALLILQGQASRFKQHHLRQHYPPQILRITDSGRTVSILHGQSSCAALYTPASDIAGQRIWSEDHEKVSGVVRSYSV